MYVLTYIYDLRTYLLLFTARSEGSLTSTISSSTVSNMFKEPMIISVAYSKLFKHLCTILKGCDISDLKVALINQAHTPDGVKLEKSMKDEIKAAKSINDLLLAFDDPSCCNWLNTRLLEVLANCSLPIAVEIIDAYRNFLFAKRLKAVLPKQHEQSEQRKTFITEVSVKINVDTDKITVGDFMRHYQDNEEVVLDLGKQILNIKHVKEGCLEINYTMPVHYSFSAYKLALHNRHKFYAIDLIQIEIGNCPLIFNPWLSDVEQPSTMPTMQVQYKGESFDIMKSTFNEPLQ